MCKDPKNWYRVGEGLGRGTSAGQDISPPDAPTSDGTADLPRVPCRASRSPHTREREIIVKVVVIGGTGLIGSNLVKKFRAHGHETVPAAPNTGVNTLTGEGLNEALAGAAVVVDVSNSPSFEDAAVLEFFETSTGTSCRWRQHRGGTSRGAVGRRQRSDL